MRIKIFSPLVRKFIDYEKLLTVQYNQTVFQNDKVENSTIEFVEDNLLQSVKLKARRAEDLSLREKH